MRGGWLLGLGLVLGACSGDEGENEGGRVDDILALTGDSAAGAGVFADNCAVCHGADGTGGSGPDVTSEDDEAEVAEVVLFGEEEMTPFDGVLTDQEIADVVAYVTAGLP